MSINSGSGASTLRNGASQQNGPTSKSDNCRRADKRSCSKYENIFERNGQAMREQFRKSVDQTNQAETIFKEQLDEQYVENGG